MSEMFIRENLRSFFPMKKWRKDPKESIFLLVVEPLLIDQHFNGDVLNPNY